MSKTPTQEKTQQDLHKYWNSSYSKSANKVKVLTISSDNEQNYTSNNKKRKAPVKEISQEGTTSP